MSKGELAFVEWLRQRCRANPDRVPLGIGDDMAAVAFGGSLVLVTADMLLDTVHFDTTLQELELIGRKAIACSLSDCAAMGSRPRAAMVSVALPNTMSMAEAQRLYEGMFAVADEFDCPIVGGDTTSWKHPLALDVSMLAEPMAPCGPVRRDGARPGDVLLVTGPLGGSILGRHLTFTPRIREASAIVSAAPGAVHAMMDLSDGLALDLYRMCQASGCSAELDESLLEAIVSDAARELASRDGRTAVEHALSDGEDFELLVAVDAVAVAAIRAVLSQVFAVGVMSPRLQADTCNLHLREKGGGRVRIEPRGYEHFR